MTRIGFLKLWSVAVGLMDVVTGLLLVFSPALVVGVMGLAPPVPDALVFLSWIGIFVLAVGLGYGMALGKRRGRGETVWVFTAMVRLLVAVFLTINIIAESLPRIWALVGLVDFIVALVQIAILRAGWWRESHR